MLDAYRIQAQARPVTDQVLEGLIFRAAHPVVAQLAPYPAGERAVLLPSLVRVLLAGFLRVARRVCQHVGVERRDVRSVPVNGR
jgi:hypothetical protein